jgi:hypothetical protein
MTKKQLNQLALLLVSLLWVPFAQAQTSVNTSGGNATGSGGTVSYTIGQIVYTTNSGSTGSIAQGVQQPYEISIVQGIENLAVHLQLNAYPNPTSDYISLTIDNKVFSNGSLQLYDINGKLIESKKIIASVEKISLASLPSATYFLKVTIDDKEVKTFKIVKTN